MPNWVRNEVSFRPVEREFVKSKDKNAVILEVLQAIQCTDKTQKEHGLGTIDFNKIIPMPEEYNKDGMWYDWCIENWGTRWNASRCSFVDGYLYFETAWDSPEPIIKQLSKMFKDVYFKCSYADENFGYNVGEYTYCNGELFDAFFPEGGSDEAYDLAADILGYDLREDEDWESD